MSQTQETIKISGFVLNDIIKELASENPYKFWLHNNHLKGDIHTAAAFVLSSAGTWNTSYNRLIAEHSNELHKIAQGADAVVVHRVIEICTLNYSNKEFADITDTTMER